MKLFFRKYCKPEFIREFLENNACSSRKPPTYTIEIEQDEIIRGKFYQKELINVIQHWNHLPKSWFLMHLHDCFQAKHSALSLTFYQSN